MPLQERLVFQDEAGASLPQGLDLSGRRTLLFSNLGTQSTLLPPHLVCLQTTLHLCHILFPLVLPLPLLGLLSLPGPLALLFATPDVAPDACRAQKITVGTPITATANMRPSWMISTRLTSARQFVRPCSNPSQPHSVEPLMLSLTGGGEVYLSFH